MSDGLLLTFNAGPSTIKIGLFEADAAGARCVGKGVIDCRKAPVGFRITKGSERFTLELRAEPSGDLRDVMAEMLELLARHFDMSRVVVACHRVVHGGERFAGPTQIDDAAVEAIDALTILALLHQPQSLRLIQTIQHLRPNLAQTASFDTARRP